MPLFTAESWKAAQKEKQLRKNLQKRQHKLLLAWRRNRSRFRQDEKIQLELRRVAKLCCKLGTPLHTTLESEIVDHVMLS